MGSNIGPGIGGIFLQFFREGLVRERREYTQKQINNRRGWMFVIIAILGVAVLSVGTIVLIELVSGWFGFGFILVALWFAFTMKFLYWFEREYPS